jgi:predicted  nucleic acid-binding Zn-ribbon protein
MCACGHVRKHHRGLRIEVTGACLKCGCEEFRRTSTPPDPRGEMMENIRAGLEQVARLQAIVADLRTRLGDDGLSG